MARSRILHHLWRSTLRCMGCRTCSRREQCCPSGWASVSGRYMLRKGPPPLIYRCQSMLFGKSASLLSGQITVRFADEHHQTILRCRDPLIRRRGLSLLARHPRQEGLAMSWSTWKAGMVRLLCCVRGDAWPSTDSSNTDRREPGGGRRRTAGFKSGRHTGRMSTGAIWTQLLRHEH